MASKTFLPTLVKILHTVCIYITRYRSVMLHHLPEGGEAALTAIVTACEVFMALVPNNTGD